MVKHWLVSVCFYMSEFLMSGFNLSTHIFHVGSLSRSNSKNPKQNFWNHNPLDQNFVRISKIVVSVYAKGVRDCRQITFIMLNRFCLLSHPPPSLTHISLLIGTSGKPLAAIGKFTSIIGKLMIGKALATKWGENYQCYDW